MMKILLVFAVVVATMVVAHPHEKCESADNSCRCERLILSGGPRRGGPKRPGSRQRRAPHRPNPERRQELEEECIAEGHTEPDALRACRFEKIMTKREVIVNEAIDPEKLKEHLTRSLEAQGDRLPEGVDAEALTTTFTEGVDSCLADNASDISGFFTCLMGKCQEALPPPPQ